MDGHMKIVKTLKKNQKSILSLICILALLFVYGCKCNGEMGTKAGNAGGISASSSVGAKK